MIKNIGILGASSFIGQELIKQLKIKNINIYIFSRKKKKYKNIRSKNIFFIRGQFNKKDLVKFFNKVDVVINLIAEIENIETMYDVNVRMLKKIISLSKKKIKKIIHISSVSVYGKNMGKILTESSQCLPDQEYGKTKLIAENLIIEASKKNFFKAVIIRPSTILGKNMKNQSIFKMIDLIKENKFFYFNNKNSNMNYIYVNDFCAVITEFVDYNNFNKYEIFNYSNKIKLQKFVKIILKRFNKKDNLINLPYKLIKIISYLHCFFKKFPLKPSRVNALNVTTSYSNNKIAKLIDIKKYNNIEKGILELIEKFD
jgi:nucleoside-diphosphate-sugar epimerase